MFKVKEFVARMGITQKELAKRIGVKPETVYKWAAGTNNPVYEDIIRLKRMGATDYELYGEVFQSQLEAYKRHVMGSVDRFLSEIGIETKKEKL